LEFKLWIVSPLHLCAFALARTQKAGNQSLALIYLKSDGGARVSRVLPVREDRYAGISGNKRFATDFHAACSRLRTA
jgi:hypothetical protein